MESSIERLVRPNILKLKPYSSARDEFKGAEAIFLDANENPYDSGFNRYPDPRQLLLKKVISELKNVGVENIFLGNGSDEAIDLLFRCFCEPGKDNVILPQPTYGMYEVSAGIQDIAMRKPLLNSDFTLDTKAILEQADEHSKLLLLCSPNNPTGNVLAQGDIVYLLQNFKGIVVVDEAYIDFAPEKSVVPLLAKYPNLVILQTFSKAWGLAGIRLGMAFAHKDIIAVINKVKAPYNVNVLTQREALKALQQKELYQKNLNELLEQRKWVEQFLTIVPYVRHIYPSDANFILVKMDSPKGVYDYLTDKGIVVRDRSTTTLCDGCLRITVGTPEENKALINAMKEFASV